MAAKYHLLHTEAGGATVSSWCCHLCDVAGKVVCQNSEAMEGTDPLAIILVSSGSRGDRLLFRFPFDTEEPQVASDTLKGPFKNPYAVRIAEDYNEWCIHETISNINSGSLVGYSDKMLCNLLVARADLCQRQFEIKVNDVVFVGYPMLLHRDAVSLSQSKRDLPTMISFNVVFALQASAADETLISCYQDLAKQLALALRHENKRCDYLDKQKSLMMAIQEEVSTMPEDSYVSPYALMLRKCTLAKQLQFIYESLCETGMVFLHINKWIQINFCLPHKVHNLHLPKDSNAYIKPEGLRRCLEALRPYHAMLLLEDEETALNSLPLDSSPALTRLIQVASPLKSLQTLALDADLSLLQVSQLVTHLVYWGKATIIYPLCESNTYMLAPHTNTFVHSSLAEKFAEQFPQMSLATVLADFSLPATLGEHRDVLGLPKHNAQQVQMVVWMLKHRLLTQIHTYIFLFPSQPGHLVFPPTSPLSIGPGQSGFETLARIRAQSVLTPVVEDMNVLQRAASVSDIHTESSPTQSSFSTRFPSVEVSDCEVISSETRLQDSLLRGLSDQQKQSIMKIPSASNQDDLKMFARLCKYFDGKHHLEEIMFYENVRRSTLLTLLDKFRDVLVTCQHEDPRISGWRQR